MWINHRLYPAFGSERFKHKLRMGRGSEILRGNNEGRTEVESERGGLFERVRAVDEDCSVGQDGGWGGRRVVGGWSSRSGEGAEGGREMCRCR